MRPRSLRMPAIALVAALLAGCGSSGGGQTTDVGNDTKVSDQARQVTLNYFRDVIAAETNSDAPCRKYLTKAGVKNIYGKDSCEGVVDLIKGPVEVESVDQRGDGARVVVYLSPVKKEKRIVTLKPEGGSLKIDNIEQPQFASP